MPVTRHSLPLPRSLTAIAEIAAALASGESVGGVIPGVLIALASELDGVQASLWLHGPDGLRRAWSVGEDDTAVAAVDAQLAESQSVFSSGLVVARLLAARQALGAISVRAGRGLTSADKLFVSTVADLLAPALRDAEHAHRLESEVAARTREIDEQRRFTEKIIDSLPVGLYVIDRAYRIQAWNRKRETGLQGVSREQAIGRTIFEILHRQPAELLRDEFESVFDSAEMQQFTMQSTSGGERRTYRISKIPMRLEGAEVSHVITVGEDITDWQKSQEGFAQAEKLAAVGTLAAGVMHELNNPLATIAACAEGLALGTREPQGTGDDQRRDLVESLELIQREVHRCRVIIDGLLEFSRPKPTEKVLADINEVVARAVELLRHHPRFSRVVIGFERGANLPSVLASEEQLTEVFLALLLNAADAMNAEGVATLRTRAHEASDRVIAEVIDHGAGIRESDQPKIFEPFYTTKPRHLGTGLGLAMCYSVISEHGGDIEVESAPGEGSVFRVLLPAARE